MCIRDRGRRSIAWYEVFAGQKSFDNLGTGLPNETVEAFRTYLIGIKGPLTTPCLLYTSRMAVREVLVKNADATYNYFDTRVYEMSAVLLFRARYLHTAYSMQATRRFLLPLPK